MPRTHLKKRKFAVFDIDGTIFRSSLLIELVELLIARGVFAKAARRRYERPFRAWLDRKGTYEAYIRGVIDAFDRHIRGVREEELLPVVDEVIAVHKDRVYRFTRDLVRDLKRRGYFLLAISHSPKYIAERFAKGLGFDKVYGRYLELGPDGRFTGRTEYEDLILDKSKVLARAVERNGLSLMGSIGVGDTESDIPLLASVSRPVCFNPNAVLYRTAVKRGWDIFTERKDVVYWVNRATKGKKRATGRTRHGKRGRR